MQTFIATLFVFAITATAMAVGVIFSNRSLRGSCGGTGTDCSCSQKKQKKCALEREQNARAT